MHENKPSLQMIFSTQNNQSENNSLSFYLEDNQWSHLLELVNEYGNFEIYKDGSNQFLLHLGEHRFSVSKDFNKSMVTMLDLSLATPGAAELLAKIADLIFFDRKRRFMILASAIDYEKAGWTACQTLEIPLKPANKDQAERFQAWETEYKKNNTLKFKSFSQTIVENKTSENPTPGNQTNK
ncbi:MAG: hypothetical protein NTV32_03400 [Gammaproteobacteria bacterium]|nr:hypothetical protein [Gammaproteobacteria bacterium]